MNLACNTDTFPFKDNEAARWKANEAKVNIEPNSRKKRGKSLTGKRRRMKEKRRPTDPVTTYRKKSPISRACGADGDAGPAGASRPPKRSLRTRSALGL